MQLITNDKFRSVEHRVVANSRGPWVSIASFFTIHYAENPRHYGPIKEILSDDSPAKYKEITTQEYFQYYTDKGPYATSAITYFKLEGECTSGTIESINKSMVCNQTC